MLFTIIVILFALVQICKLTMPVVLDSNILFYLIGILLLMITSNLLKNSFSRGWCTLSDETKVELLLSVKSYFVVFAVLKYMTSDAIFDYNIEAAHATSINRINLVLQ